jgi:predicted RecB family nuclease
LAGIVCQKAPEARAARLEQVRQLLHEIRKARREGVSPRLCDCTVCSNRDEVLEVTRAKKDLTLIWGIARGYARRLEEFGITNYDDLVATESSIVVEKLRESRCYGVSIATVDSWKSHARSYSTLHPVVFGVLPNVDSFIGLDLEYGPGPIIWLVGVCLVAPRGIQFQAFWAETAIEEKGNLQRLGELIAANPELPILTWNGKAADLPQLKVATRRSDLGQLFEVVSSRHMDLYEHATKAVRLPMPQFELTQVAAYFAIPKLSRIHDGLEAVSLFQEYQRSTDDGRRDDIKTSLVEYNRDDLEALVGVAKRLAELECS